MLYVLLFQFLIISLRAEGEYFTSKYMFDNILNQPWSEWDEDQYMGIANHEDIYSFVDNALFPALVDFDHDGDTDLVLGTASGELRYFEQVQPPGWG